MFPTDLNAIRTEPSRHYVVRLESPDAPHLNFELILPSECRLQSREQDTEKCASPSSLYMMARYVSADACALQVEVRACVLQRDANPADVLDIHLEQWGCRVLERRELYTIAGITADILYQREDGSHVIGRLYAVKDGPRIFFVDAHSDASRFPEFAQDAFLAIASFRIPNPQREESAEPLVRFTPDSRIPIGFRHPRSWQGTRLVEDTDIIAVELSSYDNNALTGRIRIEAYTKTPELTPTTIVRGYADSLMDLGLHVNGAPMMPVDPTSEFRAAWLYAPTTYYDGDSFDAPVLIMESEEHFVLLSLIGAARHHSPEWWAFNKRAFEIVRDSLRIGADAA